VFVGHCQEKGCQAGLKVVEKLHPSEAVGMICMRKGRLSVVEYSEMNSALSASRTTEGKLVYRHANIANHYFSVHFLDSSMDALESLPFHVAKKKIPYYDVETKARVCPMQANGIKLERFIFDVFPLAKNIGILQVRRSTEFSPLKNSPGSGCDSPERCRQDVIDLAKGFLAKAHYVADLSGLVCEISPLVSYYGEQMPDLSGRTLRFPLVAESSADLVDG